MDVRIGLTQTPKELEVELDEGTDPAALKAQVEEVARRQAARSGSPTAGAARSAVPAEKLAYVEIGSPQDDRRIGFGG